MGGGGLPPPPLVIRLKYNFPNLADSENSTEIFLYDFLMIMIMMGCSFKSQDAINFNTTHLNQ